MIEIGMVNKTCEKHISPMILVVRHSFQFLLSSTLCDQNLLVGEWVITRTCALQYSKIGQKRSYS